MPPLSYLQVMIPKIGITQFLTELHVRVTLERSEFPTRENARDSVKTLLRKLTTSGQFFFSNSCDFGSDSIIVTK